MEQKGGSHKNIWYGLGRQRIEIPRPVLKSRRAGARRPYPAGPDPRTGVRPQRRVMPRVTDVLLAAFGAPHWRDAADAVAQPSLTAAKLREITGVLASS